MSAHLAKPKKKSTPKQPASARNDAARISDIIINGSVHIPPWVTDHESFRRWACSDVFPNHGQFFYLRGKFWMDLSMETLIHNQIKGVVSAVLNSIVFAESLGVFLFDRMMLTNVSAGLSCEPDAMFIANETAESGLATLADGDRSLEVIGAPDVVLEVVSKTSAVKDTVDLMSLYAKAGIPEYWLVDSTIETPELMILRLTGGKYVAARRHDGWVKSKVFNRSFRLTCKKDAKGMSQFNLETK